MFAQTAERTYANLTYEAFDAAVTKAWRVSGFMTKMTMGLTFAAGLMAVTIGIVSAIKMKEYYKVDFSPIPRYMVDEKDLIGYNARGEKIVLKNQAAYYKAVTTNRQKSDYKYDEIGNLADLNGAIGRQWLALYAERNENREPILADSFKVTNKEEVPAGYEAGIHAFGSEAAENLNNPLYVWKSDATKIFVYFKTEAASISTAGANFSAGTLALTGGAGIAVGALVTALGIKLAEKRKKKLAQPANG